MKQAWEAAANWPQRPQLIWDFSFIKIHTSIDELAKEVINGKWGNGQDRKNRLTNAGYDYNAVQRRVNELLK